MANFKVDTTQLANVGFFPGREQLGGRYFVSLGRGEWLVSPKGPIKAKGAKRGEMDAAEGSWPANYYPDNALFLSCALAMMPE